MKTIDANINNAILSINYKSILDALYLAYFNSSLDTKSFSELLDISEDEALRLINILGEIYNNKYN